MKFRPSNLLGLALLAAACDSPSIDLVAPQMGKAPSGDMAVVTTLTDAGSQIRSDGRGAYASGSNVVSTIQGIGAYLLDLTHSRNTRTVVLDFGQPVAGTGPNGTPAPIPSGSYKARIIVKCNLVGVDIKAIAPGASAPCPFHIGQVLSGGGTYSVQMNNLGGETSYADTDHALVSCTSTAAPCSRWRITPSGSYTDLNGQVVARNVGKLLKVGSPNIDRGNFYFAFVLDFARP